MPIYSLEGTPGSGKTLYCVQKVIPDFLKIRDSEGNLVPRHIYTNIEGLRPEIICSLANIPYESIAEYFHVLGRAIDEKGRPYEDKDLVRWWFFEPSSIEWVETLNGTRTKERIPDMSKAKQIPLGSLIIIDELQNYYSNRDFQSIYSKACIDYIMKNRHYGWTLWWMSPSIESVDVSFRRATQYVYFLESKENYGQSNKSSIKKYEGWLAGDKINTAPFATETFKQDKRYFAAYKSYVSGVKGEKRYKTNIWLNHKGFVICVGLFILCVVAALFSDPLGTISGQKHFDKIAQTTETATATPKHQSFSGVSGGAVVNELSSDSVPCYVNHYKVNGVNYIVLPNGKTEKVKVGRKYEECQ